MHLLLPLMMVWLMVLVRMLLHPKAATMLLLLLLLLLHTLLVLRWMVLLRMVMLQLSSYCLLFLPKAPLVSKHLPMAASNVCPSTYCITCLPATHTSCRVRRELINHRVLPAAVGTCSNPIGHVQHWLLLNLCS